MSQSPATIICVDDELTVLEGLRQELTRALGRQVSVEIAESGQEALELIDELAEEGVDIPVIITDQLMPGMTGDELLIKLHERDGRIRSILLSGQAPPEAVDRAMKLANLFRYLTKPWDTEELTDVIRNALSSYQNEN